MRLTPSTYIIEVIIHSDEMKIFTRLLINKLINAKLSIFINNEDIFQQIYLRSFQKVDKHDLEI